MKNLTPASRYHCEYRVQTTAAETLHKKTKSNNSCSFQCRRSSRGTRTRPEHRPCSLLMALVRAQQAGLTRAHIRYPRTHRQTNASLPIRSYLFFLAPGGRQACLARAGGLLPGGRSFPCRRQLRVPRVLGGLCERTQGGGGREERATAGDRSPHPQGALRAQDGGEHRVGKMKFRSGAVLRSIGYD